MNSLPQEVLDRICVMNFSDPSLPPLPRKRGRFNITNRLQPVTNRSQLATVSRGWQWAIEKQTFRSLRIKSTDLGELQQFVTGYRQRYVKRLYFTFILPDYNSEAAKQFERESDRQVNNAAFTAALHGLFKILQSWCPASDTSNPWLVLDIEGVYSPMDWGRRRDVERPRIIQDVEPAQGNNGAPASPRDLLQYRYQYSLLCLDNSVELPEVPAVCMFQDRGSYGLYARQVAPESMLNITAKLPNLLNGWLNLKHQSIRYPAIDRARRDILTRALEYKPFPKSIGILTLDLLPPITSNHSWRPSRLFPRATSYDPLSSALWKATADLQNLFCLDIRGLIDLSLFGVSIPDSIVHPFWQNLQDLYIKFDMKSPSGEWYFQGVEKALRYSGPIVTSPSPETQMPPGYGFCKEEDFKAALQFSSIEEDRYSGTVPHENAFRTTVDERLMIPLVEAFAKACIQVPTLQKASLMSRMEKEVEYKNRTYYHKVDWGIYYFASGNYHHNDDFGLDISYPANSIWPRTLIYEVGDWCISEELCRLLQTIGQHMYNEEPLERYIDRWETCKVKFLKNLAQKEAERSAQEFT